MEYEINFTPFKMKEIPVQLFNSMLESNRDPKLIPITGYRYEVFYQLIRFIYTDHYTISDENYFELLKLAKAYKVIRLVNDLLNCAINSIEKLNFCVVENHRIGVNNSMLAVARDFSASINSNEFLSIHPDTLEVILKFDQIQRGVSELNIVDAMVNWMNRHCMQNQIPFSECQRKFIKLIHLIRFPTLTNAELVHVKTTYPELLTKSDFLNIAGQKIYPHNELWNCTPRTQLTFSYEMRSFSSHKYLETKFTVLSEVILGGFVLSSNTSDDKPIDITISCDHQEYVDKSVLNIKEITGNSDYFKISVGALTLIRPNFTYTIGYKSKGQIKRKLAYLCRKPTTGVIINAPPSSVKILEAHPTMHEMLFWDPEDGNLN